MALKASSVLNYESKLLRMLHQPLKHEKKLRDDQFSLFSGNKEILNTLSTALYVQDQYSF